MIDSTDIHAIAQAEARDAEQRINDGLRPITPRTRWEDIAINIGLALLLVASLALAVAVADGLVL